ncbi:MAG: hypothetical protein ABI165_15375 [Bryobacteraceae bacterium]
MSDVIARGDVSTEVRRSMETDIEPMRVYGIDVNAIAAQGEGNS